MAKSAYIQISVYHACGCCSDTDYITAYVNDPQDIEQVKKELDNTYDGKIDSIEKTDGWFAYDGCDSEAFYRAVSDYTTPDEE